jgi:phosphoserine phosphatase RsbU/P
MGYKGCTVSRNILRLCLALWMCLIPLGTRAQQLIDAEGVVELSDGWKVHQGDNPAWSAAGFDDSQWQPLSLTEDAPEPGWRWYRLNLDLSAHEGKDSSPRALLITGPDNRYEVYINGQLVPGPSIRSVWFLLKNRERLLPLPSHSSRVELAIRVSYPSMYTEMYGLSLARVQLGPTLAIEARKMLARDQRLLGFLPSAFVNLALLVAGCGAFALFWLQRSAREYRWLAVYLILTGVSTAVWIGVSVGVFSLPVNSVVGDPLSYPALVAQIEFIYAFIGRKVGRAWRVYEGFLLAFMLAAIVMAIAQVSPIAYLVAEGVVTAPVAIVLPIFLFVWWRRGQADARWLIIPSFLAAAGDITLDLSFFATRLGWTHVAALIEPIYLGPVPVALDDLADFVFLLAIGFVILLRFTRVSREQARAAAELAAAREIQQRLVPSSPPAVPGFQMLAAYLPAQEVGGDFYQVLMQPDGASLLVVGDVSGKGLRAAMTGALAIGALRTLAAEDLGPAALLERLNLQILAAEDGGFVTCLCTRITREGKVTTANAGHLAPYRNGVEIELDSGLPLGLTADAEYAESTLQLVPGDTLTLLSDGVVEARSVSGELFGFDRTSAISLQSAQQIAETAQMFGQEDDITVLTLNFAGAEILPAHRA